MQACTEVHTTHHQLLILLLAYPKQHGVDPVKLSWAQPLPKNVDRS